MIAFLVEVWEGNAWQPVAMERPSFATYGDALEAVRVELEFSAEDEVESPESFPPDGVEPEQGWWRIVQETRGAVDCRRKN